jgi:myosin heavy subunit
MNDAGGNFADETIEMASESGANPNAELRKRRSTRIVQAVPLVVTGVDALGRPFVERTSSLILNCHGCRYQSKHYVLKNMWVTLEIPHPETGQPPRGVRGRVAWIQRPRTVRQLFQVALELEVSGNVWGIAFPPEDWFAFPEGVQVPPVLDGAAEPSPLPPTSAEPEPEAPASVSETEIPLTNTSDNLRVFPSPASATDASLQLARQVARLVADARQQIQTAAQEAASQAVSAERRLSFDQWEQKFAAGCAEIANETARALENVQLETNKHAREATAAAAETLRTELPHWLGPQLEQLIRDLTSRLLDEALAQRSEQVRLTEAATESLKATCQQAEETAAWLKTQAENAEVQIAARAETAARSLESTAETVNARRQALEANAAEIQHQVTSALSSAQSSWREQVSKEAEAAQAQLRERLESTLAEAQDRAAGGLNEHLRSLLAQLQDETALHANVLREAAQTVEAEWEKRLAAMRDEFQEHAQKLESMLSRTGEAYQTLEQRSAELQGTQKNLADFRAQLEEDVTHHRGELRRESQSLVEQVNARICSTFDEAAQKAMEQFNRQVRDLVQPQISQAEEAVHRLAGSRSLVDAALTMQQERIRTTADEAFAASLASFRANLGSVETILQESSQSITGQSLAELEGKVSDLRHQVVDELQKSAEWYEKKAQTQIQNHSEKAVAQTASQLKDKAGEISGAFATELDHSSRNFLRHTQTQMNDVVRDSFERARSLFAEAADTTTAAFIDEIQRTARQELGGYNEELKRSTAQERTELAQKVNFEQEGFLRRFHESLGGVLQTRVAEAQKSVTEGFAPLLEQWKTMTDAHQQEMKRVYDHIGEQAAEQHKTRLEGVSNQWLLATVASLDHQSREMIAGVAAAAEEKLRAACSQVFEGVGDSLRQRLSEIAKNFTPPTEPPSPLAKSAKSGT